MSRCYYYKHEQTGEMKSIPVLPLKLRQFELKTLKQPTLDILDHLRQNNPLLS